MKTDYLNKLIEVSCKLANAIEKLGMNKWDVFFMDEMHLGYRACSTYLRDGAKAVIDIQEQLSREKEKTEFAKMGEEEALNFLEEMFGDRDVASLNDEYKAKIKEAVMKVIKEIEEE